jgi:hypothetical protein
LKRTLGVNSKSAAPVVGNEAAMHVDTSTDVDIDALVAAMLSRDRH